MPSINLNTGKKIAKQEPGEPRQANWKFNLIDTGANIAALDFSTNRTHRFAFNSAVTDSVGTDHLAWSAGAAYGSGVYGMAAQFDGTNRIEDDAADNTKFDFTTGDFTWCGYVYFASLTGAQTIISKKASGTGAGYDLYKDANHFLVGRASDGTDVATAQGTTALSAATWYFVGIRRTASAVQVWLNETQEASAVATAVGSVTNTQVFTLGRDSSGATQFMTSGSRIDHLESYSDDLTDAQFGQKFRDLHSGQVAICIESGSGFLAGAVYRRNEENTGWTADGYFPAVAETRYYDSDSSNYVGFKAAGTVTANKIWTLPSADGGAGAPFVTDGSAVTKFQDHAAVVLITSDETLGTDVTESTTEQISKSYTLPANTYSRIIVEAVCDIHVETQGGGADDIDVEIHIGSTVKTYNFRADTEGTEDIFNDYHMALSASAVQTASATIKVVLKADAGSLTLGRMQVKSFRVYGVA